MAELPVMDSSLVFASYWRKIKDNIQHSTKTKKKQTSADIGHEVSTGYTFH